MLASIRSRVIPALCTTTSIRPCRVRQCSRMRAPASGAVMSRASAVPPTSFTTSASASPAAGTSTPTTTAPSRASVRTMAAPMPRAAPVTTATLPASGRAASAGTAPSAVATGTNWPETYAARPESRNASAPAAPGAVSGTPSPRTRPLAVPPRRISCAMERVRPVTPWRAARRVGSVAASGSSNTVTTREEEPSERSAPPISSATAPRSAGVATPSKHATIAAWRAPSRGASATSRPHEAKRVRASAAAGVAPRTSTEPGSTGSPGVCRRSSTG